MKNNNTNTSYFKEDTPTGAVKRLSLKEQIIEFNKIQKELLILKRK